MSASTKTLAAACLVLLLQGCAETEEATPPPATRPVKTFLVEGGSADAVRTFPGRVDASQRAELAFRVPGQVQEILVKEGDMVEAGQVLARLDPADYALVYADRKATFDNARQNYERGKELIKAGNISRMDYDRMEANYRSATAALSQAEKDQEYTVLASPFRGRVAERRVESFEEVQAKQSVFSLQNISQLDVIIDVPESVIRTVRADGSEGRQLGEDVRARTVRANAVFEGRPNESFPLQPKEFSTKANAQTQTFRATFSMDAPTNFTLLPGMTATVLLDLSHLVDTDGVKRVPVRAVQGDSSLNPRVWILDPATMTVTGREVTLGRMTGGLIEITDGLVGGEEIVAVGAPYLAQGMQVTRMAVTEQAVPRAEESL